MKTAQEILSDDAYSLLGINKVIAKLVSAGEEFDEKELRHAYKQLEVNQRTQRQKKPVKLLKITGPPGAYQIDLIFLPKYRSSNRGITIFLLLVEIPSRKAFAYPLKSQKPAAILDAYEQFYKDHDGNLNNVYGDDEFNSEWFKAFNDVLNVNVHTGIAKDDHISKHSNRLGIIDRLVRTLRKLMNKYMLLQNDTQWSKWLPKIISIYNKTPHSSLNNRTPDEVSADVNGMEKRFHQDVKYNQAQDAMDTPVSVGDTVRILEKKATFAKEGPTFSKELYVVVKKDGFKWRVHPKTGGPLLRRKFADNDLLVINPDTLVALHDQPVRQDIDEGVERHRTRLQREGIIKEKSDLDRAVALPIKVKLPRKSKVVSKDPIKLTLSRDTDQARQKILKTYKRLSDMEEDG
jgi:hypothetical protein